LIGSENYLPISNVNIETIVVGTVSVHLILKNFYSTLYYLNVRTTMMEMKTIPKLQRPSYSIEVHQAYKRYTVDTVVLNGFNMKVPQGKM